jgi:hypothetical protein
MRWYSPNARSSHHTLTPQRDGIAFLAATLVAVRGAVAATFPLLQGSVRSAAGANCDHRAFRWAQWAPTADEAIGAQCLGPATLPSAQDATVGLAGAPATTLAGGEQPSPESAGSVGRAPAAAPSPLS